VTRPFGRAPDGLPATLHRLSTPSGRIAEVCDWGGIVHRLEVPGPGGLHPLLLSLPSIEAHAADPHYIGVLIGRVANRIAGGRVPTLGLTLPVNHGAHHLHGGPQGLHAQRVEVQRLHEGALRLHHHSPDGAGGYPGTLDLSVVIALSDIDGLSFSPTPCFSKKVSHQLRSLTRTTTSWEFKPKSDKPKHKVPINSASAMADFSPTMSQFH
jgi:aldose 1-epimerase